MKQEYKNPLPYSKMERISRGSLGEVYRGVDADGKTVAIKRLRTTLIYDREERDKLIRETKFLRQLNGVYFPKWLEGDLECEEPYFVMEWVEGKPLNVLFPALQMTAFRDNFIEFAASCLNVLKIFQDIPAPEPGPPGLIHGDLNPKNLLVGSDAKVRIFDFSHAIWVREGETSLGGTRGYMGLEQMAHGRIDLHTDLFAMGLLWAEVLRGAPLLSGRTLFAMFLELRDMNPGEVVEGVTSDPKFRRLLLPLLAPGSQSARERLDEASQALRHL